MHDRLEVDHQERWTRVAAFCCVLAVVAVSVAIALTAPQPATADAGFPGTGEACAIDGTALDAELATLAGLPGAIIGLIADGIIDGLGVTWVDPSHPMQSETGVVEEKSDYATNDLFIDHDSHDQAFDVRPDASSQFLMSDANIEDKGGLIENEWESNDFPTWAWPNVGDRVWLNGNWVLDCNHEEGTSQHYDAEIHPMRAIAAMRHEVHTLPGSGTTPVAVTGTDLYIHGNGGYDNTVAECGVNVILLVYKALGNCTPRPGLAQDYDFEIPLGAAPFAGAVPASSVADGPGNTLSPAPTLSSRAGLDSRRSPGVPRACAARRQRRDERRRLRAQDLYGLGRAARKPPSLRREAGEGTRERRHGPDPSVQRL